jgi:hypothetical protein
MLLKEMKRGLEGSRAIFESIVFSIVDPVFVPP